MITQKRLKELLSYNPATGIFTRLNLRGNWTNAGGYDRQGYRRINIDGDYYFCHRLAFLYMEGDFPKDATDHINHIRDDNRWSNLRCADAALNSRNNSIRKDNTSGVVGVTWHKGDKKWQAQISSGLKNIYLGSFDSIGTAKKVREEASKNYNYHPNHGRA
jgi:hypothetical protein